MDESKLPKWAQKELNMMRNRIVELEGCLATANGEACVGATGRVTVDSFSINSFPLHDRATVTFRLPNGEVSCALREDGVYINSSGTPLALLPRAVNSACIQVVAR